MVCAAFEHAEHAAKTCIDIDVSEYPRLVKTFNWYMKILVVMKVIFWGAIFYAYSSTPP